MAELVQDNWIFLVIALVIGLLVAWWIFAANRTAKVQLEDRDEGEKGARRNQALIDAPPAATGADTPAASPANADIVAAATATGDAEAGPAITPSKPLVEEAASATEPAPAPTPAPAPAAPDSTDDLTLIKGLGPKLKVQLGEMGITSFAQIAAWDEVDIDRIDAQLGRFQGRIRRDNWVEQAKLLAAGDRAAYESQFGRT